MRNPAERLGRFMARHTAHRWVALNGPEPIISMTFDDVLASATRTGAQVLEDLGCRGTFYAAGSLTAGQENARPTHTLEDLQRLHSNGHEIASHGWAHIDYARATRDALADDLQKNQAFLQDHLDLPREINFAYPFGRYNWTSKRTTQNHCQSARILGKGLHRDHADLNLLGCERLYGKSLARTYWEPLLRAMRPGDWLIVTTHEVEPNCGQYGCTPSELAGFIRVAQALHCRFLPIRDAITHWAAQSPRQGR